MDIINHAGYVTLQAVETAEPGTTTWHLIQAAELNRVAFGQTGAERAATARQVVNHLTEALPGTRGPQSTLTRAKIGHVETRGFYPTRTTPV